MNTDRDLILEHVTKLYEGCRGIKDLSIKLSPGEIAAFVGPNGVGKTTLVKAVAGLLPISEGSIRLCGQSIRERSAREQIGYMQSDISFYDKMTVYEVLEFICKVKYSGNFYEEIAPYLQSYHLYEQRNFRIHQLSLGMKRKLSLIMTLIGTPKLILLDEPESGVDTYGIIQFKADLLACARKGSIVILTSHVLDLLEKVCTRCIFLKGGRIAEDLSLTGNPLDLEQVYERVYRDNL